MTGSVLKRWLRPRKWEVPVSTFDDAYRHNVNTDYKQATRNRSAKLEFPGGRKSTLRWIDCFCLAETIRKVPCTWRGRKGGESRTVLSGGNLSRWSQEASLGLLAGRPSERESSVVFAPAMMRALRRNKTLRFGVPMLVSAGRKMYGGGIPEGVGSHVWQVGGDWGESAIGEAE